MSIKKLIIVLAVSAYSFTDKVTKKLVEGCTFHYVMTEDLTPVDEGEMTFKGYKIAKATLSKDSFSKFGNVPAIYEAVIDCAVDSKGNATMKVTDIRFVSDIAVTKALPAPKLGFKG